MKNRISYKVLLEDLLKSKKEAVGYLNTMLQESLQGDKESRQLFLIGIKNVIEAWKVESKIAKKMNINRKKLREILSIRRLPKWHVILELLNALEIKITLN